MPSTATSIEISVCWLVRSAGQPSRKTTMRHTDVVVAGAGLAGLTCAFELSSLGCNVLLLEAHEVVGGRTSSWIQDGMPVESGLHRVLGFYQTSLTCCARPASISITLFIGKTKLKSDCRITVARRCWARRHCTAGNIHAKSAAHKQL